ncbi:hypothetical protein MLD38_021519 [Melastoma candidum]|uniref:Uncharacterized protein n=1 Tax=Melastoma candidum TaxID=119954 RepID=A0ACB9QJ76_9MYRT|nr:hypothetical protein MLD38_021519 [Melastoma candidum]
MPLRRYLIRNDYASSDPELYRQADKDDPEALLEAVSMSGLVGLLRQLGDLAEFAAEIFHDLHEGVLATASRGHDLIVRVQQLETEFPLVEKALLSHTNHSSFFYNTGADWHPSMRSQENLIAQGDLPRFIMDSYEECRPPPRLFLLDKFDVAGAGACLKRYSDPALFKEETVLEDMQKEKKIRRIKKKGLRGKNGATPEFMQVPHTKLHELFLEERVEISNSSPSRLVKLKRRQFKESSFDSKNGKSYMEKFINTSSPDSKTVFEDPVSRPVLLWTSESILPEAVEIQSQSPMEIGLQMKDNTSTGKYSLSENSCMEHLNEMLIDEKEMMEPASAADEEMAGILDLHDLQEMQLAKMAGKIQNGISDNHYDEITSEVENYVDAVATLESEVDADSEFEARTSKCISKAGKHETDSVTTDEQGEHQRQFSDSQSWDYSVSDDVNTFIRRGSSTFSYSDGQSNLIDNILSDGDGVGQAFSSSEAGTSECILDSQISNMLENTSEMPMKPASNKEEGICMSALTSEHSASLWPFLAEDASINQITPVFSSLDDGDSIEHVDGTVSSDIHSEKGKEHLSRHTSENYSINVEEARESIISSDPLQHPSTFLHLPDVAEIDNGDTRETFNIYEDVDNIDKEKCRSGLSFAEGSSEDQFHLTDLSEVGDRTGLIPFYHSSTTSIANDMDADKPVSAEILEDISPVVEPSSECVAGEEDILHIKSKVQNYVVLDDTSLNERNESTYRCRYDVMKLAENSHAIVDDERAACTEAISGNNLASDLFIASNDDHLGSADNAAMYPSSKAVSSAITSSCRENVSSAESSSGDAASTSHLKMQELDPDPATSDQTVQGSNDIAGAHGYTEEEKVFQEEQGLIQSDLKSPGDFTFEMEEQCSPLPEESLELSDSQGIGLAVMDLEAKPARKSGVPLSSEAELFSLLDNQLVEHEEKLEKPPELKAGASGVKLAYIEETDAESSTDNLEQMQSSSLLCREDTLSRPGPSLESLPEVENHMLDVQCSKDSRVITSLPCPGSDIVLPSDSTEDEYYIFKSHADDHPSQLVRTETLEEPALHESAETKEDETLVSRLSAGMIREEMPPILSVDSKVHSSGEDGLLNSLSLSTVDQSPATQSQSQANPVPSESKVLNSITALHREDSPVESLESVSGPMILDNSNKLSETIFPYPQKSNFQSVWQPAEENTDVVSGQPPTAAFQGEILPAMSSESSPVSDSTEGQPLSGHSEADNGRLAAGSAQLEMRQDEPLMHGPPSFEGEIVELAVGKIPRPPKRLIEAVAAHDRSMLRKVTERKRPPMEPQVNERDSLLEQIRTKSFNLKPTLAARPSIQGPKTNLKVAAILEKANAIRQAFAGSDEDDDDSWSDS